MDFDFTGTLTGPLRAIRDMIRQENETLRAEHQQTRAEVVRLQRQVADSERIAEFFYQAGCDTAPIVPIPRKPRRRWPLGERHLRSVPGDGGKGAAVAFAPLMEHTMQLMCRAGSGSAAAAVAVMLTVGAPVVAHHAWQHPAAPVDAGDAAVVLIMSS